MLGRQKASFYTFYVAVRLLWRRQWRWRGCSMVMEWLPFNCAFGGPAFFCINYQAFLNHTPLIRLVKRWLKLMQKVLLWPVFLQCRVGWISVLVPYTHVPLHPRVCTPVQLLAFEIMYKAQNPVVNSLNSYTSCFVLPFKLPPLCCFFSLELNEWNTYQRRSSLPPFPLFLSFLYLKSRSCSLQFYKFTLKIKLPLS